MTRPLITTKLHRPRPRHALLARPRLMARLDQTEARLILVSSPAGFGKTTMLAEWMGTPYAGEPRRVGWLALEAADNEPERFWAYVVAAIGSADPSLAAETRDLIVADWSTDLVITALINDLAAASGEIWLVLDDYHLIDDAEIRASVASLLNHLPRSTHVVLSTRADPDLPLPSWRARGELVEIRAADLRLDDDEVGAYLNDVARLDLERPDVEALGRRTEGWIAALQLAALSIRDHPDASGFIAQFAGTDRYVVDYLVDEVLDHQPVRVREFLLCTAILDRLTGGLCDAVTGADGGTEQLLELERDNVFLIALDNNREWYRYHHLFADILRARIANQQPARVGVLHLRASEWYEHQGLIEDAVRHAFSAEDFQRAAYLMELALPNVRRQRQDAMYFGWLRDLPEEVIRQRPVLSVFFGSMHLAAGDVDAVEPFLRDAERALASVAPGAIPPWAETDELRTLPATIEVYRASVSQVKGDGSAALDHARAALELAGPDDHLARGAAHGFLGLAAWGAGDLPSAIDDFSQAIAHFASAGNVEDELSSTLVLADMWSALGRPSTARDLRDGVLDRIDTRPAPGLIADLHVGLAELDLRRGDIQSARQQLDLARQTAVTAGRPRWYVAMAGVLAASGQIQQALESLDEAQRVHSDGIFPNVRPIAALRARMLIRHDRLDEAADAIGESPPTTPQAADYLHEFGYLTWVRLVLARHRRHRDRRELGDAAQLLDRLLASAVESGRPGSEAEILMLQALLADASGDRARGLRSLGQALERMPAVLDDARLFLDEVALVPLLRESARQGAADSPAARLVTIADQREAPSAKAIPAPGLLTARELEVLTLLDRDLSAPQIARALFVSHNTLRTHTKHIYAKLEVNSRRAAIACARERGLI